MKKMFVYGSVLIIAIVMFTRDQFFTTGKNSNGVTNPIESEDLS